MAAATSLATLGYAADKPRHSITTRKMFSSSSSWPKLVGLFAAIAVVSLVEAVPAAEQKPTIPIIVKDTTTYFWQIVLAGARKAGKDLNVNVPQLGAQSESDINGQISILEKTENYVSVFWGEYKDFGLIIMERRKPQSDKPRITYFYSTCQRGLINFHASLTLLL
jgi:hypothetical protein